MWAKCNLESSHNVDWRAGECEFHKSHALTEFLSYWTLGCTVEHWIFNSGLEQDSFMQSASEWDLTFLSSFIYFLSQTHLYCRLFSRVIVRAGIYLPLLCISLAFIAQNNFFFWEKHHLYGSVHLRWTCEWGPFITLPLFLLPTLSLVDISEVLCAKCEGKDNPLLPLPAPTESGQLSNVHFVPRFISAFSHNRY